MKKAISVLLLACMSAMFTACVGGGDSGGGASNVLIDLDASHVPEVGDALVLPLTDTPVEFVVWGTMDGGAAEIMTYQHESEYFQELARRTGISIRYLHPPQGAEQENFNLMVASGVYPDVIQGMGVNYPGGWAQAIADGLVIDVMDLSKRYAPYYWEAIHRDEETRRQAFTDDGRLVGFHQIAVPQPPWIGMVTRQDWLDQLGLDTPVTFDDWEVALTLFKDEMGADAPLLIPSSGFPMMNIFQGGFDTMPGFMQVDGRVRFGPLEPGFKEYLELMNRWFSLGLIDPDFTSRQMFIGPQDMTTTGRSGLWPDVYVLLPVNRIVSPDPGFRSVAVPAPVRYPGQTIHMHQMNTLVMEGQQWMITENHSDPILFTRLMNYIFSPEGALHANFGIEGVTFEFDETGTPRLTEFMYNNPDGLTSPQALSRYTRGFLDGFYYDWRRELTPGIERDVLDALDIWVSNVDFAWLMPPITLSTDEGMENTRIMNDVNTYRDEMVVRFITGFESFSNWDNFINTMHSMGIERAIEIQQGALDRYFAR